jgi:AcrR family transcriptional regulator
MIMTVERKRLSRQEAQVQTRERLIEAARQLFVERGFGGTSLRDIAEQAGYSQGAFYSNFTCKEAVLLELLKRHVAVEDNQLDAIMGNEERTIDQILVELETRFETLKQKKDWSILAVELQLHALRSPTFAESYACFWREHEQRVASLIGRMFGRLGTKPPAQTGRLAIGFMALINGLVVQESVSSPARIAPTLSMFLRAVIAAGSNASDIAPDAGP